MCVSQNAHIYNIILLLNSNNYFRLFLLFFVTISQFKTLFHDVEQFYVTSVESQNVKRQNQATSGSALHFFQSDSVDKKPTLQEIKQIRCLFQEISSPEAVELCDPEDRHDKDPRDASSSCRTYFHTRKPSPGLPSPHRTET